MDIFSKNSFLIRIVVLLILLNLCTISYLWWGNATNKRATPPKKDISKITKKLAQTLDLSQNQQTELEKIRIDFFSKEEILHQLIKSQRDSMNLEMFSANTDTNHVKSIASRVAQNELKMELYRFAQAQQLKHICTPQQLDKLNHIVLDIRDYFQPIK